MPSLDKKDLEQIKETVIEAVGPYFTAIQENFNHINERFDTIEKLILADHKRRIERLETEVKELRELLAVK